MHSLIYVSIYSFMHSFADIYSCMHASMHVDAPCMYLLLFHNRARHGHGIAIRKDLRNSVTFAADTNKCMAAWRLKIPQRKFLQFINVHASTYDKEKGQAVDFQYLSKTYRNYTSNSITSVLVISILSRMANECTAPSKKWNNGGIADCWHLWVWRPVSM